MRLLIDRLGAASEDEDVDDDTLERLYAVPGSPWLRANMVSTLDGAATGANGRSGSINDQADHRVFALLRSLADAVLVGAGTARTEGYHEAAVPLVLVSRRAEVPPGLRDAAPGKVLLATCASSPGLGEAQRLLGDQNVLVLGRDDVDVAAVPSALAHRGLAHVLCEGGPHLLGSLLTAGVLDELCLTLVPRLLSGDHPQITAGRPVDLTAEPAVLLAEGGTLLGRWILSPRRSGRAAPAADA